VKHFHALRLKKVFLFKTNRKIYELKRYNTSAKISLANLLMVLFLIYLGIFRKIHWYKNGTEK